MPKRASPEERFEEFVAGRWTDLARFGFLLTGNFQEAQDLAQEALAKSLPHWHRLDAPGTEAYVRTVMSRLAWRHAKRTRPSQREPVMVPSEPVDESVGRAADVGRALASLSRDQRVVVVLRYWADLDEAAIADLLKCRRGTVKSRASRAYAQLRNHPALAGYFMPEPTEAPPERKTK